MTTAISMIRQVRNERWRGREPGGTTKPDKWKNSAFFVTARRGMGTAWIAARSDMHAFSQARSRSHELSGGEWAQTSAAWAAPRCRAGWDQSAALRAFLPRACGGAAAACGCASSRGRPGRPCARGGGALREVSAAVGRHGPATAARAVVLARAPRARARSAGGPLSSLALLESVFFNRRRGW